jgi:hypothetical protein
MIPANVSSSGSLVRGTSRNGIAIRTGADLRPGSGLRSEVTIVNLGALPATFRLFERNASNGFSAGRLGLAIHELRIDAGRRIYVGEIGAILAEGIDLGRFEGGESRTYRFAVFLSRDTPDRERERSAGAAYEWHAVPEKQF